MKKLESLYSVAIMQDGVAAMGNRIIVLRKFKNRITKLSRNYTSRYILIQPKIKD